MKRLMITGCGGHFMGDVVQCYRNQEIEFEIIGVASKPDRFIAPLLDEYRKVPVSTAPNYVDCLIDLCKQYHVDILIPTIDEELVPLYLRKDEFESKGTKVSVYKAAFFGNNKSDFVLALKKVQLPYPETIECWNTHTFEDAAHKMGYPNKDICVKLINKAGSRGFRIISRKATDFSLYAEEKPNSRYMAYEQFRAMLKDYQSLSASFKEPILVQKYLSGDEYSVDLLAVDGKTRYIVGRRNVDIENSIPLESVLEENEEAYDICRKLVKTYGLDGSIGIDFIFNNGHPIPIEMNARITATISLAKWGGCNLAYLQVLHMLGMEMPEVNVEYGKRLIRRYMPIYERAEGEMKTDERGNYVRDLYSKL